MSKGSGDKDKALRIAFLLESFSKILKQKLCHKDIYYRKKKDLFGKAYSKVLCPQSVKSVYF